ncbi:MAG: DeoR/GlpR transcriptional regulator [Rhodobacteraceae bacterium]|nr:DeoR/GlpR transcriptional regulator [Paracoccaceae bacterium]
MSNTEEIFSSHRAHELLGVLRENGGSCRTAALASLLNVSEETVRRNIKHLAKEGVVIKVHGGVLLANRNEEPAFGERMEVNRTAKRAMANCVVGMIEDGASMFIDNSSSTTFIADALRVRKNLFVVTNSIKVAERLSAHNHNRVFFAGGELRETDGGSYGTDAMNFIKGFNPDFAILSATAVNLDNGFMSTDLSEAEFARAYVAQANASIVVADQSKIGQNGPIVFADTATIDVLVTDTPPPAKFKAAAKAVGMKIIIAPKDKDSK